jgi:hypothetical protein
MKRRTYTLEFMPDEKNVAASRGPTTPSAKGHLRVTCRRWLQQTVNFMAQLGGKPDLVQLVTALAAVGDLPQRRQNDQHQPDQQSHGRNDND